MQGNDVLMAPWSKDFRIVSESVRVGDADDLAELDFLEVTRCSCVSKGGAPICNTSRCANYAMQIECVKCGPGCVNKRIQKDITADIRVIKTDHKGYGLFANEDLIEGAYIREYIGEIVTLEELILRRSLMGQAEHLYAMEIKKETYIDSTHVGSISRYINHSCEPNCTAEVWVVKGRLRVAITTLKDIKSGEELTFDYCWEPLEGRQLTKCYCGTPSCRGTIEITTQDSIENGDNQIVKKTGKWRQSSDALKEAQRNAVAAAQDTIEALDDPDCVRAALTSSPLTAHLTSNLHGEWLLGKRVRVWWEGNQAYFEGDVTDYNSLTNKHKVYYILDHSINDELLWTQIPENPWLWLDESQEDSRVLKRKIPKFGVSLHFLRPPLPSPTVIMQPTHAYVSPEQAHFVPKVKSIIQMTEVAVNFVCKVLPIFSRYQEEKNFQFSDEEKLDFLRDTLRITLQATMSTSCAPSPVAPRPPIYQYFGNSTPQLPMTPKFNDRYKELAETLCNISSEVSLRISEVTRDKLDGHCVFVNSLTATKHVDCPADKLQRLSRHCIVVSLYGRKEDIEPLETMILAALADYRAAIDLWKIDKSASLLSRQPLTMAKDWRVLFDKDTEVKIQVEAGDSTGRHKKRRFHADDTIQSIDVFLSFHQPEVLFYVPPRPVDKTAVRQVDNKESVSSISSLRISIPSLDIHPNVYSSHIAEALYTKCITHIRSLCGRMKLNHEVTLHAVLLMHRALRIHRETDINGNLPGLLSAILSISLKVVGLYKLKNLHKICLSVYCELYQKDEKAEITKFGFLRNDVSNGLYPIVDSLGYIYMNKLLGEEARLLKCFGMDVNVTDISAAIMIKDDNPLEYFSDRDKLRSVYGQSCNQSASNRNKTRDGLLSDDKARQKNLLQAMHLFVTTNCFLSTSKLEEIDISSDPYCVRVDCLPPDLIALGSYALACALFDLSGHSDTKASEVNDSLPFSIYPLRQYHAHVAAPPLFTRVVTQFEERYPSAGQVNKIDLLFVANSIQLQLAKLTTSIRSISDDIVTLFNNTDISVICGEKNVEWYGLLNWCHPDYLHQAYNLLKEWLSIDHPIRGMPMTSRRDQSDFIMVDVTNDNEVYEYCKFRVRANIDHLDIKNIQTGSEVTSKDVKTKFVKSADSLFPFSDYAKLSSVDNAYQYRIGWTHNVKIGCNLATFPSRNIFPLRQEVIKKESPILKVCFINNDGLNPKLQFISRDVTKEPIADVMNIDATCFTGGIEAGFVVMPMESIYPPSALTEIRSFELSGQPQDQLIELYCSDSLHSALQLTDSFGIASVRRWPNARVFSAEAQKRSSADRNKQYEEVSGSALLELSIVQRLHYMSNSGTSDFLFCPFGVVNAILPETSRSAEKRSSNKSVTSSEAINENNKRERQADDTSFLALSVSSLSDTAPPAQIRSEEAQISTKKKRRSFVIPASIRSMEIYDEAKDGNSTVSKGTEVVNKRSFNVALEIYELCGNEKNTKNNSTSVNFLLFPAVLLSGSDFIRLAAPKSLHVSSPGLIRLLCHDLLEAIQYCTTCGVVFRYLTIDHVSINRCGRLILSDLSCASSIECSSGYNKRSEIEENRQKISAYNSVIPVQYMHAAAIEVLLGGHPTEASSVYSTALLLLCLITGNNVMRPLVDGTRDTSVLNISEDTLNEVKKKGGDKYTHCQLQQLYRVLGTPKTAAFDDFGLYPLGRAHKAKLVADVNNEIDCRCRLPKLIGAFNEEMLKIYSLNYSNRSLSFAPPPEWTKIGRLDVIVHCMQLNPRYRPDLRHVISHENGLFDSLFALPMILLSENGELNTTLDVYSGTLSGEVRLNAMRYAMS